MKCYSLFNCMICDWFYLLVPAYYEWNIIVGSIIWYMTGFICLYLIYKNEMLYSLLNCIICNCFLFLATEVYEYNVIICSLIIIWYMSRFYYIIYIFFYNFLKVLTVVFQWNIIVYYHFTKVHEMTQSNKTFESVELVFLFY